MKRKIIILHFNMELGGAESSLLGLLDTIDYDRYDVDLFLYAHEGELMSMLNPNVRLLPEMKAYRALTESMKQNFAQGCIPIGMARAAAKVRCALSRGPMQSGHNSTSCASPIFRTFRETTTLRSASMTRITSSGKRSPRRSGCHGSIPMLLRWSSATPSRRKCGGCPTTW